MYSRLYLSYLFYLYECVVSTIILNSGIHNFYNKVCKLTQIIDTRAFSIQKQSLPHLSEDSQGHDLALLMLLKTVTSDILFEAVPGVYHKGILVCFECTVTCTFS